MEKYDKVTDEQLIRDFRNGDREIMDHLMMKYKAMVRKSQGDVFVWRGERRSDPGRMIGLIKAVRDYDPDQELLLRVLRNFVCQDRCIPQSRHQKKKHIPLNSYVSLYDDSGQEGEERRTPLIDTIEPVRDNDPEVLYLGKKFTEVFIEQLKDTLSPLENHVLYLHLMGTDYKTIAELLGKSPKSIDNALQRIKAKAEKMLDKSE